MAQVIDNPVIADGSSIHQGAKQYMQTGKPLGTKQVQHMAQILLDQ